MRNIIFNLLLALAVATGLAGCPSQQAMRSNDEAKNQEPATPAMAPMQYSWNTNYSAMLTPPLQIRESALAACQQRGFDRAYMQTVSLDEDVATAYFSCRGSDN